MDIIKEMISKINEKDKNSIYLREIALLMEEIDSLKGELRVKQNLVENYEKILKERNEK
jgi:hypothetical protein